MSSPSFNIYFYHKDEVLVSYNLHTGMRLSNEQWKAFHSSAIMYRESESKIEKCDKYGTARTVINTEDELKKFLWIKLKAKEIK